MTIPFPTIDIRQQYARIGMKSEPGGFNIKTRPAEIKTQTHYPKMEVHAPKPELVVDNGRTREALHGGKLLELTSRITSQISQLLLQRIGDMVDRGNRMAAIHIPHNPIPDIAMQRFLNKGTGIQVFGPAAISNADYEIVVHDHEIHIEPGYVDMEVITHKPEIEYQRGSLQIYMEQHASVTITPPQIDIMV